MILRNHILMSNRDENDLELKTKKNQSKLFVLAIIYHNLWKCLISNAGAGNKPEEILKW